MALESIFGETEMLMKASGRHVSGMGKDAISFKMEIFMSESINGVKLKD